jgi:uncharacterized membrane protein YedE/YeeE
MEEIRQRMLWIVLLSILALIVFWLVLRYWHMRHATPPNSPEQALLTFYEGTLAFTADTAAFPLVAGVRRIEEGELSDKV